MDTNVHSPGQLFQLTQTLEIPLFQRPYVWTEDRQWAPLWEDVQRLVALRSGAAPGATHFLGAVVMQKRAGAMGFAEEYALVDGQQRLTTLQLLLNAASVALRNAGAIAPANNLRKLTLHDEDLGFEGAQRLKVRHTNSDAGPFREAMLSETPADADQHTGSHLITAAHRYFFEQVSTWLASGPEADLPQRATALATTLSKGFEIVVISLSEHEDSQSIFETLNARGTPLTQADLVKNLVFQKLEAEGADTRRAYQENWSLFDQPFWTTEVRLGRFTLPQVSLFLNHWLISRTGEEVRTPSTFARFKHWLEYENTESVLTVVHMLHARAMEYQGWITAAESRDGAIDPVAQFFYRTFAAGTRAVTPIALWLFDKDNAIPRSEAETALRWFESWVVRRAVIGLSAADNSRTVAQVIMGLGSSDPTETGSAMRELLASQDRPGNYWPTDEELARVIYSAPVYRSLPRARLRMVLEAVEDDARGYTTGKGSWSIGPVPRDSMNIEHILPRQWRQNWPVSSEQAAIDRDEHMDRLGNLTLLTMGLNSSVSNRAWDGPRGKRESLTLHDVLLINRPLRNATEWDEKSIDRRTKSMTDAIIRTWPAPEGHTVTPGTGKVEADTAWVDFRHVVGVGLVKPGTVLRSRSDRTLTATVLADGRIEFDGNAYDSPSGAGKAARGGSTNGWAYWLLPDGRQLRKLKEPYRQLMEERRAGLGEAP